jgi:hypothetical protein
MVKLFTCGHTATVQPWKQQRTFNVDFPCASCRNKQARNVAEIAAVASIQVGSKRIVLVARAERS